MFEIYISMKENILCLEYRIKEEKMNKINTRTRAENCNLSSFLCLFMKYKDS